MGICCIPGTVLSNTKAVIPPTNILVEASTVKILSNSVTPEIRKYLALFLDLDYINVSVQHMQALYEQTEAC